MSELGRDAVDLVCQFQAPKDVRGLEHEHVRAHQGRRSDLMRDPRGDLGTVRQQRDQG